MAWDAEAYEAERKREHTIKTKLEAVGYIEGSELGDSCRAFAEFLESAYLEYMMDDDDQKRVWDIAEKAAHSYIDQLLVEVGENGADADCMMDLVGINQELEKAGVSPVWPEGFTPPTAEDLEEKGLCVKHPYEYYFSPPRSGCDTCIRIYVKKNPEKK